MGEGSTGFNRKGSEFEEEDYGMERVSITIRNSAIRNNSSEGAEDATNYPIKSSGGGFGVIAALIGGTIFVIIGAAVIPTVISSVNTNSQSTAYATVAQLASPLITWIPLLLIVIAVMVPIFKSDII
jgi:hypothetical protein